jgi:8-oxo-dGTP pyrophosphatase MutT (NUDIX family)
VGKSRGGKLKEIRACGVLVLRDDPERSFLLMKHAHRWDLPKGHLDDDETDEECALRELREETGIKPKEIELVPGFVWQTDYEVNSKRFGERCHKTVVIYLAKLLVPVKIKLTEHPDFEWIRWNPPHRIQEQTIDPLLAAVESFLKIS